MCVRGDYGVDAIVGARIESAVDSSGRGGEGDDAVLRDAVHSREVAHRIEFRSVR